MYDGARRQKSFASWAPGSEVSNCCSVNWLNLYKETDCQDFPSFDVNMQYNKSSYLKNAKFCMTVTLNISTLPLFNVI